MAKIFDVYVDKRQSSHNTQEFDVFLNRHMTECDVIVYALPYREGTSAISRMILEDCLESYVLQKFIAVQYGSELVSHIDEMIKECYARLNDGAEIDSQVEANMFRIGAPQSSELEISSSVIPTSAELFTSAVNAIGFIAEKIRVVLEKNAGILRAPIGIVTEITNTGKSSCTSGDSAIGIGFSCSDAELKDILSDTLPNEIAVSSAVEAVLIRYRLLSEMDDFTLSEFDDMALEEVDFIVV